MTRLANGPDLWKAVLGRVFRKGTIIAGGCVRDHALGLEPKDIDVIVPIQSVADWAQFLLSVGELSDIASQWAKTDLGKEYAQSNRKIKGTHTVDWFGYSVNLIGSGLLYEEGPDAVVDTFDFDILKAYYWLGRDGFDFRRTRDHGRAVNFKVATIAHNRHVPQSISRFLRFNARNPGVLSLCIPWETPYELP